VVVPVLFFVPAVSLAGYLINPKVGAVTYNFIHHKAVSVLLYLLGSFTHLPGLQLTGVVLFGHSSPDRVLGTDCRNQPRKENNNVANSDLYIRLASRPGNCCFYWALSFALADLSACSFKKWKWNGAQ